MKNRTEVEQLREKVFSLEYDLKKSEESVQSLLKDLDYYKGSESHIESQLLELHDQIGWLRSMIERLTIPHEKFIKEDDTEQTVDPYYGTTYGTKV